VSLNDAETKASLRHTKLEDDGAFKFNYVPEGQYELKIGAGDVDKNATGSAYAQMFNPTFSEEIPGCHPPDRSEG